MQGKRSAVGSLPEVLGFDHGSTSSDAGLEQQMRWTSMRNSTQNRLPDYLISSSNPNVGYLNASNHQGHSLSGWDFGEGSSRRSENTQNDQKSENGWSSPINVCSGGVLSSERQHHEPSHILSLNNVAINLHNNEEGNRTSLAQNSESNTIPRNLNMVEDEDDDCQVVECPSAYKSGGSVNERMQSAGSSSNPFRVASGSGGYLVDESDGRPGCSLDGRRLSCKRKSLEGNAGQSSGSGSAQYTQHTQSNLWNSAPARHNASSSSSIAAPAENSIGINVPEQVNPRLGLSVGHVASEPSPAVNALGTAGSSRRNFRLRINASHQQDSVPNSMFSTETDTSGATISSNHQRSLRLIPRNNNSLDLRPASGMEIANTPGQSVALQVSSMRRNAQSRLNRASSSRTGSSSGFAISGDRDAASYDVSTSAGVLPRNISEYSMFVPPSEARDSFPNPPPNWGLAGGSVSIPGNVVSTSRSGSGAGMHSAGPSWVPHRNPSRYPQRLSEYVSRSLLSSTGTESGGQSSSYPTLHSGASSSHETALPSGSGNHGRHSNARSAMLLDRHLDSAFGIPYSLRTLAAASEGRSRLVSEVCLYDFVRRFFTEVRICYC